MGCESTIDTLNKNTTTNDSRIAAEYKLANTAVGYAATGYNEREAKKLVEAIQVNYKKFSKNIDAMFTRLYNAMAGASATDGWHSKVARAYTNASGPNGSEKGPFWRAYSDIKSRAFGYHTSVYGRIRQALYAYTATDAYKSLSSKPKIVIASWDEPLAYVKKSELSVSIAGYSYINPKVLDDVRAIASQFQKQIAQDYDDLFAAIKNNSAFLGAAQSGIVDGFKKENKKSLEKIDYFFNNATDGLFKKLNNEINFAKNSNRIAYEHYAALDKYYKTVFGGFYKPSTAIAGTMDRIGYNTYEARNLSAKLSKVTEAVCSKVDTELDNLSETVFGNWHDATAVEYEKNTFKAMIENAKKACYDFFSKYDDELVYTHNVMSKSIGDGEKIGRYTHRQMKRYVLKASQKDKLGGCNFNAGLVNIVENMKKNLNKFLNSSDTYVGNYNVFYGVMVGLNINSTKISSQLSNTYSGGYAALVDYIIRTVYDPLLVKLKERQGLYEKAGGFGITIDSKKGIEVVTNYMKNFK